MTDDTMVTLRAYLERAIEAEHAWSDANFARLRESQAAQDTRLRQAIEEADKRTRLALDEARRAVDKAEKAVEGRLALLNEFRGQSADQQKNFVTLDAFSALKEIVDKNTGKAAGIGATVAVAVSVIAIVLTLTGQ